MEITAAQAKEAFESRLSEAGATLESLDPETAVGVMARFYRDVRASDVALEDDGDMLLYQWGVYDWGEGPSFELDLTRQFIVEGKNDDDAIFQLSLTLRFDPAVGLSVERGHEWCLHPDDVETLQSFITDSAAFRAVAGLQPIGTTLTFGGAG